MAAPGRHVGRYIHRHGRFLVNNVDQWVGNRSFGRTAALQQQAAEAKGESTESVVVPRKKTWSKEAVLEALASTVSRDPTAYAYRFQDDPYLTPRTFLEFKMFSLAQESGRDSAKYFVNRNPKFFTKDFAEPHIPCLMPETVSLRLEDVSEEALQERINLRKVKAAVDMYDQLLQAGSAVSMETTHQLLDLICVYCDQDPVDKSEPEIMDTVTKQEMKRRRARTRRTNDLLTMTWRENNNAERIFNLLPERDTRCYSALIRGMVKYGAHSKAFSLYTDLLNNRMTADVHIFNALISATPEVRELYSERWELISDLMTQMSQQKVRPDLLTFNSVLKALRRTGLRMSGLRTLSEMKALGIAPSLATYNHILAVQRSALSTPKALEILQDVMPELSGTSFTCRDPDDVLFFSSAMKICLDSKDLELGYRVQDLVEVGDNWKLLGDSYQQSVFYGRFFNLVCMMENIDRVLQWYRRIIPSLYYPNAQGFVDLLQALDTDGRLDVLPMIWKDAKSLGHDAKPDLIEQLLELMVRDQHSPEVQESLAVCALDMKSVLVEKSSLDWKASSLSHITTLLLRANRTQEAWETLQLFKSMSRVPSETLLNSLLSVCVGGGGGGDGARRAVELVQLSAAFSLPETSKLAKRALAEVNLSEEQRSILSELDLLTESWEPV